MLKTALKTTVNPHKSAARRLGVTIMFLVIPTIFLALYNLTGYPRPWFDEGLNFQPAKNLNLYGQYALLSSEGFRVLDPALQTGPPVILPVALSLKILGIGLFQARLVSGLFCILTVVVYHRIARILYTYTVSWVASILLLTFAVHNEFVSFLYLGRQLLGEVPALFYFLSGLLLWFQSWKHVGWRYLVGAGLLFGLAMITKSQFGLTIPIFIFIIWLIGSLLLKILRLRHFVLPAVMGAIVVFSWYGAQIAIVGPQDFFRNISTLYAGAQLHIVHLSWITTKHSLGVLVRTGYIVWGGVSLLYGLWSNREPGLVALRRLSLLIFAGIWLAWYTIGSIGWARYAFVPIAISHIFYAAIVCDAVKTLLSTQPVHRMLRWVQVMFTLALLVGAAGMVSSGQSIIPHIILDRNESYFQFARYLNESIPREAIVESWEWELDLITDLRYHHPPTWVTNLMTQRLWAGDLNGKLVYDTEEFAPVYLIVGPFARGTNLYGETGLLSRAELQVSIGEYELYRLIDYALPQYD